MGGCGLGMVNSYYVYSTSKHSLAHISKDFFKIKQGAAPFRVGAGGIKHCIMIMVAFLGASCMRGCIHM